VRNYVECLRTRKTPNASLQAGYEAACTSWSPEPRRIISEVQAWENPTVMTALSMETRYSNSSSFHNFWPPREV